MVKIFNKNTLMSTFKDSRYCSKTKQNKTKLTNEDYKLLKLSFLLKSSKLTVFFS